MLYATEKEINICKKIVLHELRLRNLTHYIENVDRIVKEVLNLVYSKGGDYTYTTVQSFAETYFECKMYKKVRDK